MKEARDLTPAELMNEGRRWVIAPGEYIDGKGFRVGVIFEDHPFRFPIAQMTNMPSGLPQRIYYFHANADTDNAQQAAQALAEEWCRKHQGIDREAYFVIISSSIKAYE